MPPPPSSSLSHTYPAAAIADVDDLWLHKAAGKPERKLSSKVGSQDPRRPKADTKGRGKLGGMFSISRASKARAKTRMKSRTIPGVRPLRVGVDCTDRPGGGTGCSSVCSYPTAAPQPWPLRLKRRSLPNGAAVHGAARCSVISEDSVEDLWTQLDLLEMQRAGSLQPEWHTSCPTAAQ